MKIPTKVRMHEPIRRNYEEVPMVFIQTYVVSAILLLPRFLVTLVFAAITNGLYSSNATKWILQHHYKLAKLHNRLNHYIEYKLNKARCKHLAWWHKNNEASHHKPRSIYFPAKLTLSAGMVGAPEKCCIPFDADLGDAQQSLWRRLVALISSPVSQC